LLALRRTPAAKRDSPSRRRTTSASRVGPNGVGPIIIGTTPAQAAATGTLLHASAPARGSSCFYLRPVAPAGVVDDFRVGDPLANIRQFYGSRARVRPGKYDPHDQTLTIEPPAGGDPKFRLIFALRKGIVQTIYAGALPQVAYVQGCS
jgi:hypothetical protein